MKEREMRQRACSCMGRELDLGEVLEGEKSWSKIYCMKPGLVPHALNPRTLKAEAGESL